MTVWQSIKNFIMRGGYALTTEPLKTINDHPDINIDPRELTRIRNNFAECEGKYQQVEYRNTLCNIRTREYMHMNMVKLSAELLSGLVFNEQCEVSISGEGGEDEDSKNNKY